jgi:hypothetical protein
VLAEDLPQHHWDSRKCHTKTMGLNPALRNIRQLTARVLACLQSNLIHHHHKPQGLEHLARSVSRVTAAVSSVSSVSQLFSLLVDCSGMILKGFGIVAFFAFVTASSFCIHLFCLVCICNHLELGHVLLLCQFYECVQSDLYWGESTGCRTVSTALLRDVNNL